MSNARAAPTYRSGEQSVTANIAESPPEARGAALEFLCQLATEVSKGTVNLPCFPNVVLRIRKALADPDTTPEQTVKIVGAEPRLAARLLQVANSVTFNPSGKPITDLRGAITRLGHLLVQCATMAFAVQQMKNEASLRVIARPLSAVWNESISVASISQVVARRTKVNADEAFLTGLLHSIGRLYIMVRAIGNAKALSQDPSFKELVTGWHAAIGKAVLENWGFPERMSEAVGDQGVRENRGKHEADLSDVLIVSVVLAETLRRPQPRIVTTDGIGAFQSIGLSAKDCAAILKHTEYQLGSLHDALGC